MKSAFFTLFTLAAGAFASPVAVARDEVVAVDAQVTLGNLTETIKTYTGAINVTVSNVASTTLTADEQSSLIDEVLPQFEKITTVLQTAVKTAASSSSGFTAGLSATSDILEAVECLVSELLYTVLSVVEKTGISHALLSALQLVMVSLGSLIHTVTSTLGGLDGLDGLVSAIESILDLVLSAVTDVLGSDSDILGTVTGLLSLVTSVL